jgi:PncC family amidohydrolase
MKLEETIARQLISHHYTLAIAESCTGGLISHKLTNVAGISQALKEGGIFYSNESKTKRLGIPQTLLARVGAVSESVARLMARNIARSAGTHFGLSTTGIAGPGGATKTKPVGLVYIGLATPDGKVRVKKYNLRGTRIRIKEQAARAALELLGTALGK